jgi:hypothetical protein
MQCVPSLMLFEYILCNLAKEYVFQSSQTTTEYERHQKNTGMPLSCYKHTAAAQAKGTVNVPCMDCIAHGATSRALLLCYWQYNRQQHIEATLQAQRNIPQLASITVHC